MEKKFLKLNDIDAYKRVFHLSNIIWEDVIGWKSFAMDTIGKQYVRSVDSISANIAEGFGRYSKKDKIRFYRIAAASIKESFDWNEKALTRKLITKESHDLYLNELQKTQLETNQLIKYTNLKLAF